MPHKGRVAAIRFAPPMDGNQSTSCLLVSIGEGDEKFKLWALTDNSDIYSKSYTMFVRSRPCLSVDIS